MVYYNSNTILHHNNNNNKGVILNAYMAEYGFPAYTDAPIIYYCIYNAVGNIKYGIWLNSWKRWIILLC